MGVVSCGKRTQDKSLNYCGDSPPPLPATSRPIQRDIQRGGPRDFTLRAQRTAILVSFNSGAKQEEGLTDSFFRWGKQRPWGYFLLDAQVLR